MINAYHDDPIRLFDSEGSRVFPSSDVDIYNEDTCFLIEDDSFEYKTVLKESSYERNSSILPITFFDIEKNVKLLKQCCPLIIKLVDCDKYPWYGKQNTHSWKGSINRLNEGSLIEEEEDCIEIISGKTDDLQEIDTNKEVTSKLSNKDKSNINVEVSSTSTGSIKTGNNNQNIVFDLKNNKSIIGVNSVLTNVTIDPSPNNSDFISKQVSEDDENLKDIVKRPSTLNLCAKLIHKAFEKLRNSKNNTTKQRLSEKILKNMKRYKNTDQFISYIGTNVLSKNNLNYNASNINDLENYLTTTSSDTVKDKNDKNHECIQIDSTDSEDLEDVIRYNKDNESNTEKKSLVEDHGSRSPLLPCPLKYKKKSKKINIEQKNKPKPRKSRMVCGNQLFSADRIIPHYHNTLLLPVMKTSLDSFKNVFANSLFKNNKRTTSKINSASVNNIDHKAVENMLPKQQTISAYNKMTNEKPICSVQNCNCKLNEEFNGDNFNMNRQLRQLEPYTAGNNNSGKNYVLPILSNQKSHIFNQNNKTLHTSMKTFPVSPKPINYCTIHACNTLPTIPNIQNGYYNEAFNNKCTKIKNNDADRYKTYGYNFNTGRNICDADQCLHSAPTSFSLPPERLNNTVILENEAVQNNTLLPLPNICSKNVKASKPVIKKVTTMRNNNFNIHQKCYTKDNDIAVTNSKKSNKLEHQYSYLIKALEQPPLKMTKQVLNVERNNFSQDKSDKTKNIGEVVSSGYSPPILPIPTYRKTLEVLANIELYEANRDSLASSIQSGQEQSKLYGSGILKREAQKRKCEDNRKPVRKISISEYKHRSTLPEIINLD